MFFERWHRVTTGSSVLLSTAAIGAMLSSVETRWAVLASGLVAVLAVFDLVVGTVARAREQEELARHFFDLERRMLRQKATWSALRDWTDARLSIDAKEPPVLVALSLLAHNDVCEAMGHERGAMAYVSWWRRTLAHFWSGDADRIPFHAEIELRWSKLPAAVPFNVRRVGR